MTSSKTFKTIFLFPALTLALFLASLTASANQDYVFKTQKLEIIDRNGKTHIFKTEIADTKRLRARGLQFRKSLPLSSAMLFDFKTAKPVQFWMKNTPIPLDMLFVNDRRIISRIVKNTTPFSLDIIPSNGPVRWVIEVRAGTVDRLNLGIGDKIRY